MHPLFTKAVLFRSGLRVPIITEDVASCLIGSVIEIGKERFLAILAQDGVTAADGEMEFSKLLVGINKESLLSDPLFLFSIQLGMTDAVLNLEESLGRKLDGGEMRSAFKMRLDDILPPELADYIFKKFPVSSLYRPTTPQEWKEKVAKHFDDKERRLAGPLGNQRSQKKSSGTETRLVPCPECGLKKRCDDKTKRFNCKPPAGCGFQSPYPIPAS